MRQEPCGSFRCDNCTVPAGGGAEEGIFISAQMPAASIFRRPGRLPDSEGAPPIARKGSLALAGPGPTYEQREFKMTAGDPFNLERFVTAQAPVFETVLSELRAVRKRSHWMWFVFPQLAVSADPRRPCFTASAPSTRRAPIWPTLC